MAVFCKLSNTNNAQATIQTSSFKWIQIHSRSSRKAGSGSISGSTLCNCKLMYTSTSYQEEKQPGRLSEDHMPKNRSFVITTWTKCWRWTWQKKSASRFENYDQWAVCKFWVLTCSQILLLWEVCFTYCIKKLEKCFIFQPLGCLRICRKLVVLFWDVYFAFSGDCEVSSDGLLYYRSEWVFGNGHSPLSITCIVTVEVCGLFTWYS